MVEVSTATRRGRGRGVFKKINRPSTRLGQRVGTTRPSTRAWVCCSKKYKLEFRFPKNNRNTIIFCRCCCLGTEIPIYHFLKQHTHALVEGWFVPTLCPRLVDGRLFFFKTPRPRPRRVAVSTSTTPRRWVVVGSANGQLGLITWNLILKTSRMV